MVTAASLRAVASMSRAEAAALASTSCESLRDKNRAQLDGGDRKRLNNCIDYNRRSVTPLKLNLFGDLPD